MAKMFAIYVKHRSYKRAYTNGLKTEDIEKAKERARKAKTSWWGQNGVYEWIKVKDLETKKYVYEA